MSISSGSTTALEFLAICVFSTSCFKFSLYVSVFFCLLVLQLCCNQLTGGIPPNMGSLKKLSVLALQHNRLNGTIPLSLGDSGMLKRLDLSFNHLSGSIPASLANITQLEVLDVQNNSLSGVVPPGKFFLPPCSF